MKKLYGAIILALSLANIQIFPMEQSISYSTYLPSDIVREVALQIIATSDTKSEVFETLTNFARTDKALRNYLLKNKKEIQSLINIKFELDDLATGMYENSDIHKKTIEILTNALKNNSYSEKQQDILKLLFSKASTKAPAFNFGYLHSLIVLMNDALELKDYKLAAVILGALNKYGVNACSIIPEDKRKNSLTLKMHIKKLTEATENFISKLPESLTIPQIQILNLLYVIGSEVYEDDFSDAMNNIVEQTNNQDVNKYYFPYVQKNYFSTLNQNQ